MGNWRERPRRFFRKQKPPWSAIRNYDRDPPLEFWQDGIPLWEKKFCMKIGCVPWGKIVDSKKFIDCHANILNWDDSACEEAFHNAKRRFWADMNGHQCDIYQPDPDKYIDKIDWNPEMDSEMIEELDWAYFAPNVAQSDDWLEYKNKRTRNSGSVWAEGHIEDPGHMGNPREHDIQCIENTGHGWSQWNSSDSGKVNNDGNPWDSRITQVNRGMVDNAWRDKAHQGVTSWETKGLARDARGMVDNAWRNKVHQGVTSWKTKGFASDARGMVDYAWRDKAHQGVTSWETKGLARDARGMVDNAWRNKVHQGVTSWKTKGFASDSRNNTRGWNQQGASNFDQYNRPWNNSHNRNVRNLTDRIQPNIRGNEQDWTYQYRYGKRPKDAEFGNIRR